MNYWVSLRLLFLILFSYGRWVLWEALSCTLLCGRGCVASRHVIEEIVMRLSWRGELSFFRFVIIFFFLFYRVLCFSFVLKY
jgi:hypothetical protein